MVTHLFSVSLQKIWLTPAPSVSSSSIFSSYFSQFVAIWALVKKYKASGIWQIPLSYIHTYMSSMHAVVIKTHQLTTNKCSFDSFIKILLHSIRLTVSVMISVVCFYQFTGSVLQDITDILLCMFYQECLPLKLECLYSVCQCQQTLQNVNYTDVNKVHQLANIYSLIFLPLYIRASYKQ